MNCKPGDVAYVAHERIAMISCRCGDTQPMLKLGTVVRVEAIVDHDSEGPLWALFEPQFVRHRFECGAEFGGMVLAMADRALRPLRDPGEDAVDEMVLITRRVAEDHTRRMAERPVAARDHNRGQWP